MQKWTNVSKNSYGMSRDFPKSQSDITAVIYPHKTSESIDILSWKGFTRPHPFMRIYMQFMAEGGGRGIFFRDADSGKVPMLQ